MNTILNVVKLLLQPVNLAEIGLVSLILFTLLEWARRTVTRRTARTGLAVVLTYVFLYLLANLLDLFFIRVLLERFSVVAVFGLIVVFQSELRRLVNRVGRWGLRRSALSSPDESFVEMLVEAARKLAESRTGALVAIQGRESWESHVTGGERLDGYPGTALLYSIFDPHSPGHDGAVLVEGDRITRFGAHLPLSSHLREQSPVGGTRHAAALGLSEVTDAFVVVVSEERGTISVARDGRIRRLASADELKPALESFLFQLRQGGRDARGYPQWPVIRTGIVSFVLAVMLWFAFTAPRPATVFRTYTVPVELYGVPRGWTLRRSAPSQVQITLVGTRNAFQLLELEDLIVSFDLGETSAGRHRMAVSEAHLRLPPNLSLHDADPETVLVELVEGESAEGEQGEE